MGTGLGLSICRRLITEMGGRVGVESQPGRGTTFRVRLRGPLQATVGTSPEKALAKPKQGMRVLVVDDEAPVGQGAPAVPGPLARHLGDAGRAREALSFIAAGGNFDAILCDLMMPEMSGPQFHEALRGGPTRSRPGASSS